MIQNTSKTICERILDCLYCCKKNKKQKVYAIYLNNIPSDLYPAGLREACGEQQQIRINTLFLDKSPK